MPTVNELLSNPVPVNRQALYARLREIIALGWQDMPADVARYNGTGGPGNFLEDMIGLKAGNQDIADVLGWEVKYYTAQTSRKLTWYAMHTPVIFISSIGKIISFTPPPDAFSRILPSPTYSNLFATNSLVLRI